MKMKAYELAALAAKNPEEYKGKKYKVVEGHALGINSGGFLRSNIVELDVASDGQIRDVSQQTKIYFSSSTEVEEIQEPVDFMTALNSGKRFKSETWSKYNNMGVAILLLSKIGHFDSNMFKERINGKWYIEP